MTTTDLLSALEPLPDEARVPVGWVRERLAEETPQDFDEREATIEMWGEIAVANFPIGGLKAWRARKRTGAT